MRDWWSPAMRPTRLPITRTSLRVRCARWLSLRLMTSVCAVGVVGSYEYSSAEEREDLLSNPAPAAVSADGGPVVALPEGAYGDVPQEDRVVEQQQQVQQLSPQSETSSYPQSGAVSV